MVDQPPIGAPAQQPGDVHGAARRHPRRVREGERRQAGACSAPTPTGACPVCKGLGVIITELGFGHGRDGLRGVRGQRFSDEVLEYTWSGKNIAEVLVMSVAEASGVLRRSGPAQTTLARMVDVGLGYITLGQRAQHPLGGRAAAPEARDQHGQEGRGVRARRADHGPAPGRRRQPARRCSTGSSTPATG